MYIAGIDEAGRGPVVGPMVMAIVSVTIENLQKLETMGITDSKLLSPAKREQLYKEIKAVADEVFVVKESAKDIDTKRKKYSLNIIEVKQGANLINMLKNVPKKIYVDCPDVNTGRYKETLYSYLDKHTDLVVEHKADYNYVVAGAASIIAKVERDNDIKELERKLKVRIGSGYPSDPRTKEFIHNCVRQNKVPDCVRKSWQTYTNAKNKIKQKTLI